MAMNGRKYGATMKRILVWGIVLSCILSVSACGWRLRGTLALPSNLNVLHVDAVDAHGDLITDLKRLLMANKITLTDKASEAPFSVLIVQERSDRRTVSVSNNALVAEYELTMEVDYRITEQDKPDSVSMATASVVRSFDFDENDVIGKGEEEGLIQKEMRRDLVQQIVRRLQVLASSSNPAEPTLHSNPDAKTTP